VTNEKRCQPPLPDAEVEKIARSVSRYEPEEPPVGQSTAHDPSANGHGRQTAGPEDTEKPKAEQDWETPIPFDDFDLPRFPLATLPDWQQAFVKQLSEETQTPADMAAVQSLAAVAVCVARNVEIEARSGWREPLNLFTLTVLESGNRKSKVVSEIVRPLEVFESDLARDMRDGIAEAINDRTILVQRLERAQKDCAKLDGEKLRLRKEQARKIARELEAFEIPVAPRFFVDDVTPETLASKLCEQGGRIGLFSAEGGIFETIAGRYSNGAPNLDVFLKGHCGDTLRIDRRHRSEHIERPALTIGLAVQSDVLRGLTDKPGFRGRGLLGRFLYCLPVSTLGRRKARTNPINSETRRTYEQYLIKLAAIQPNGNGVITLQLSRDADDYLVAFQEEIEPKFAEGGEFANFGDWAGKLCGAILRIAGIIHLADSASTSPHFSREVSAETLKRAIEIGRYFVPHAQAAYSEMGADPQIEAAKYALRWIVKWAESGDSASFRKQDIWQGTKGKFKKVSELDKALGLLCEHFFIRQAVKDNPKKPGRRPGGIFEVNPSLTSYKDYKDYKSPNNDDPSIFRNCRAEGENENSEDREEINPLNSLISPQDSENQPARVSLMITRDPRQRLYDLGFSKTDVDQMKPEKAHGILTSHDVYMQAIDR
jgi:hypothetical protein